MSRCGVFPGVLLTVLICFAPASIAQDQPPSPGKTQFRPSFQISPLNQRFDSRPGRVVDFEFTITGGSEPRKVRVEPVALKQSEDGQIGVNEERPAAPDVRLLTPQLVEILPDKKVKVEGRITIPNTNSNFQTYGILVTDLGETSPQPAAPAAEKATVGVKFITRYLLRVDVNLPGLGEQRAGELSLVSGKLYDNLGRAAVMVEVNNPTESQFEIEARAQLIQESGSPTGPAFKLSLPARAMMPERERYRARLLAGSKVRMISPVREPLFPGGYKLVVELLLQGRPFAKQEYAVVVAEGQFPAQATVVAQVVRDVLVSPVQMEFSARPRGNRVLPLRLDNNSGKIIHVTLTPRPLGDTPGTDWLVVSPASFELPPGRGRNVMVTVRRADTFHTPHYAMLNVKVEPTDGTIGGSHDMAVALLPREPIAAKARLEPMKFDAASIPPAFLIPVVNEGPVHVPLNGTIRINDAFKRELVIRGGFDRWLMPGQTEPVRFPLDNPLPPGDYQLIAEINTGPNNVKLLYEQKLKVNPR